MNSPSTHEDPDGRSSLDDKDDVPADVDNDDITDELMVIRDADVAAADAEAGAARAAGHDGADPDGGDAAEPAAVGDAGAVGIQRGAPHEGAEHEVDDDDVADDDDMAAGVADDADEEEIAEVADAEVAAAVGGASDGDVADHEGVADEVAAGDGVADEGVAGDGVADEGVAGDGVADEGVAGDEVLEDDGVALDDGGTGAAPSGQGEVVMFRNRAGGHVDVGDEEEPVEHDLDHEDEVTGASGDAHDDLTAPDAAWGDVRPLDPTTLAGVDPSQLEEDLDAGTPDDPHDPDTADYEAHGPASSRTAADLTSTVVMRDRPRPPASGWRRVVYEVTGGLVRPSASRPERDRMEQLDTIRTLVTQPRRIAVLSRKGGVGKTTTAVMLGQTLASQRGDRIIAVDGNPDAGGLAYRVTAERPSTTITDLLNDLDGISRYADARRYTIATASGLEVLASDDDPHISTALGEEEYTATLSLLDHFYNLILIDTGTGILDGATQGILDGTDQIVLVVGPSLDAARAASQTLDWLTEHGLVSLVETAVAVINCSRRSSLVDLSRIEEHFYDRCGATVRVPWDRYLEAGAETDLGDLRPATRQAYLELATAVATQFDA